MKVKKWSRSVVWLFATPWTVTYQAPPSMGFSRQECWTGLPFPSPGYLPDPGIKPGSPALQAEALPSEPPGTPNKKPVLCPENQYYLGNKSHCSSWKEKNSHKFICHFDFDSFFHLCSTFSGSQRICSFCEGACWNIFFNIWSKWREHFFWQETSLLVTENCHNSHYVWLSETSWS